MIWYNIIDIRRAYLYVENLPNTMVVQGKFIWGLRNEEYCTMTKTA